MNITPKTIILSVGLMGFLTGNAALAQNLILNPGFNTGDLTDWTPIGATSGATISVIPTGGNPTDYAWMDNTLEGYNLALSQTTANGSAVGAGITIDYSFDLLGGNQAAGGMDFIHIFDENASGGVISQGPGLLGPYFHLPVRGQLTPDHLPQWREAITCILSLMRQPEPMSGPQIKWALIMSSLLLRRNQQPSLWPRWECLGFWRFVAVAMFETLLN